ncbi:nucleophile aminohydrolase [Entophlyctis helioformis]|nr:nucleophile aminohydrolase [Entophlyctis helioformis]
MEQQRRIPPSLFGVRPHSDVTMQVGQFLKSAIRSAQQAKVSSQSREPRFTAQQIEIEVKLGMVLDKQSRRRISLPILSETVIDSSGSYFSFSSNMSRNQHATLNQKLNAATVRPGSGIRYVHLREEDLFYTIRGIGKVRKTVTKGTQQVKCIISKMGVANLEVFLPTSALDYRVSVNLERHLSDIESIYQPEFVRGKDRLSYTMSPFQVDLTQVRAADQGYGSSFGSGDEMLHEGRIHQVEYALEAVKQGSAAVGIRSDTHAVVFALKRSPGELASYQKKILKIDDHMGIAFAGLTSDARVLSNFMRTEAMKSRMIYDRPLPLSRIVASVGDKAQINTQRYGKRPYGVGLLVVGFDETGPHLYECSPSGNYFDYVAMAIGARSQSAKTYLENHFSTFAKASLDEIILHGLRSLRDTLQQDKELNINNCSVGVVGKDTKFYLVESEGLQRYLDMLADTEAPPAASTSAPDTAATNAPAEGAAMDTDP